MKTDNHNSKSSEQKSLSKIIKEKTMRKIQILFLLGGLLILSSCAKDIYISYQADSVNTGKVVLKPNRSTFRTYVTINDSLIVNEENVKSVIVQNVPEGEYNIHYSADNSSYKDELDCRIPLKMENGKEVTKLVEVPPNSTGYWIYTSSTVFLPWIFLVALYQYDSQ